MTVGVLADIFVHVEGLHVLEGDFTIFVVLDQLFVTT